MVGEPHTSSTGPDVDRSRREFLLRIYDRMYHDIDRHIVVVWQSVGVLAGAFVILALAGKEVITIDVAAALLVLTSAWLLAHVYDAAYWYNRNLVIIANIERQFLRREDLREVLYYFGKHRKAGAMLSHLRIQFAFGTAILVVVLLYHFVRRVLPGLGSPWRNFDPLRSLPYLACVASVFLLAWLARRANEKYEEFLTNSPGIPVDTAGIDYGVGHPSA